MKTSPHIFRTRPHFVEKVWGGRKLADRFGKELPDERRYGESWEVADLDEGQSVVDSGPLQGLPLRALSEGWRRALVGRLAPRCDRFPLLVKLLDAARDLSVQVHPGPEDAALMEDADSKEETWLILDACEEGEIVHGLVDDDVSAPSFREAAEKGELEPLLRRVPVGAGDIVDVAPGTIHAICAGVALLEIQEPSDTTYRVYDYDRPGLDGALRPLHLDEALQVAGLGRSKEVVRHPDRRPGIAQLLSENRAYRVERLDFEAEKVVTWGVDPDTPQVLHLLEGEVVLEDGIGGTVELRAHQTAVIPAILGSVHLQSRTGGCVVVAGLAVESLLRQLHLST